MSITAPFVRSAYNYDTKAVSDETGLKCEDESLAQQQFADESDPNKIIEQFARTRDQSLLNVRNPQFGDFTGVNDFHSAMNAVLDAEESFMTLDANLRARFDNDPGKLLDFMSKSENYDECVKLGLFEFNEDLSPPADAIQTAKAGGGKSAGKTPSTSKKGLSEAPEGESGDE